MTWDAIEIISKYRLKVHKDSNYCKGSQISDIELCNSKWSLKKSSLSSSNIKLLTLKWLILQSRNYNCSFCRKINNPPKYYKIWLISRSQPPTSKNNFWEKGAAYLEVFAVACLKFPYSLVFRKKTTQIY